MTPCDLSAVEARRLIGNRQLSPVELLESCLSRIAAVNAPLKGVVALDADRARLEAEQAEAEAQRGEALPPLHGLPIGIKDLIDVSGLRTTYGSPLFAEHLPEEDEGLISRLRDAGGLVFAKTNCPEWGAGGNTTNPVYGASGNPFAPELTCGGSSGGSAIALATGMMPLAHGSDNAGSLRIPASFCGVVGFRPSHGLVPSERRAMGASPLMLEGPMGRDVDDTHLMLRGLLGDDSRDYFAAPVDPALHRPLEPLDLSELRVAISEDLGFAPIEHGLRATFQARTEPLRGCFAQVADRDPDFTEIDRCYDIIRAVAYIASWGERYKEWGDKVGPLVDSNMKSALAYNAEDVGWAYAQQTRLYQGFQAYFADFDLLLCPTMGVYPWPKEVLFPTEVNGQPMRNYFHYVAMTYGITLMGHPAISIPCGLDDRGLPFGLQIVGPRHGDLLVLRAAKALERVFAERPESARPKPDLAALEALAG